MKFLFFLTAFMPLNDNISLTANYNGQPAIIHNDLRGLEIRYIQIADLNQTEVIVDHVSYPLFNNRQVAVDYATQLTPKKDYCIVYVRTDIDRPVEIIHLTN